MKLRDYILVFGCASFLTFVVLLSLLLADKFQVRGCGCPKVISHNYIFIFITLSVIFVASILYFLFSINIDKKTKIITNNRNVLYSILGDDEKELLDFLISNDGQSSQQKLSGVFTKLKAHRLIKKLEDKNIITVKRDGKNNVVYLRQELFSGGVLK